MQRIPNRVGLPLLGLLVVLASLVAYMTQRTPSPETPDTVNFRAIDWYAGRARIAYQSEQEIRSVYPGTVFVGSPDNTDVLYFLELDHDKRQQVVTVRGTDNLENALQDAEYLRAKDSRLGIAVHRGFDKDTRAIYADLKPRLKPDYEVIVTGHSLGAAISTLLMMYLQRDGFALGLSVNFGQPKLTNQAGAQAFESLPLLRVVDGKDVVPLLPADTLLDSIGGRYTHLGREVILLDGPYYVYLDRVEAEQDSKGSFWHDLGQESLVAHKVDRYVARVAEKVSGSQEVDFKLRDRYLTSGADAAAPASD